MPQDTPDRTSVTLIGECMIELREVSDGQLTRGYGGDVLNTAVYLSRLLGADADVRFTTVMGDDPFSDAIVDAWRDEGILCDTVGRKPRSNAGLYMIRTDAVGERTFHYWRGQSPARDLMASGWSLILDLALQAPWIYVSGITLAILDDAGRERLMESLDMARRRGAALVFDGNFRPSLWPRPADAATWHTRMWRLCSLALAGAEDEAQLFGDTAAEDSMTRLQGYGIPEIVIKRGPDPILLGHGGTMESVAVSVVEDIVDTTAAGDSFNAGYLNARIRGMAPNEAAEMGMALAATVIQYTGAVIPMSAMPSHLRPSN